MATKAKNSGANKTAWMSNQELEEVAITLVNNNVTVEAYLDSLRENDYMVGTKRIYGKTLAGMYYKLQRQSAMIDSIKALAKEAK